MENSDFTNRELSIIRLFFGASVNTQPGDSLNDDYFLESDRIDHPIGDRLEAHPNGFIVTFEDDEAPAAKHPWYFQRNIFSLWAALERLTSSIT